MQDQIIRSTNLERGRYQDIGLILGPMVFLLFILIPQQTMSQAAWYTAAVSLWMAIWWATEAIPVPATALLPIVAFPMLGIASLKDATSGYANPIIFLFLGAFLLALAVERWNLHKRIALSILSVTGTNGKRLIGGFMLVAALLSMWMTNTSTTMMLLPIALSVTTVIADNIEGLSAKRKGAFQVAMLLGLAYAATIGGMSTLVGTPPNALLAAFIQDNYGIEMSFARWMALGVPIMCCMLPITWVLLTRVVFKVDIPASQQTQNHIQALRRELGVITKPEKRVAILFCLVIVFWIMRRPLATWFNIDYLSDPGIVMTAAILLFVIPNGGVPVRSGRSQPSPFEKLMTWEQTHQLPWGVLILFGGGLSLAASVSSSGLAQWLGESLMPLGSFGILTLIIAATGVVIFLTELTSNLATTATFLPVMAAVALQLDISPLLLCIPITLAASCAFMLPVATAPNAIVFASGKLTIPQMVKVGVLLNMIGMALLTAATVWWSPYIFS
ncbi:SLC13 family permease [Paraglaciecola sp.]|uniref:SLC13 family permease n=1 Tax=Paraglaciecola sp. TaxID=1920173 RepID=UPI00273DDF7A|nr:SLC13 family permease [Paraglaciecola sp.]MDP5030949.1 SLC13 family permease [Paraglaciecola sp.]